jgi:hypothetical protein
VPASGAYFGIDPSFSTTEPRSEQANSLGPTIHRSFGIVSYYTSWANVPLTSQFDVVAAGSALPMVSMQCSNYPDASVAAGDYDAEIEAQAKAFVAYGRPILLRWFWEMNEPDANPTCLGTGPTEASEYVAAYIHIWNIFQSEGATNVAFVWAPSAAKGEPSATAFYPGSQYVNWIGADLYDRSSYPSFAAVYSSFYSTYSPYGKPMMLSETGASGATDQVAWLQSIASSIPSEFPQVHAVVYVDALSDPYGDYYIQPGGAGMAEYAAVGLEPYFFPQSGYSFTTSAGVVYSYGTLSHGSVSGPIPAPIVGLSEGPGSDGYWLAGADGSIYNFGDAKPYGSMRGHHLNKPMVGIAATTNGAGYWLDATDGGIFSFGDAKFYGSTGAIRLNKPIVGMAAAPDGEGYWLVAADGGVFCFGDAHYLGSLGADKLASAVVGLAEDPLSGHYRLVTARGAVFQFPGGELSSTPAAKPVVAIVTAA